MTDYALDTLVRRFPLPTWRRASIALVAALFIFTAWACLASVNQVATAPGTVVPTGQVRVIQHLEGGIVTEIAVREGDVVTAGQALLRLKLGVGGASREELLARTDGLALERARLMAEASGIDLELPPDIAERRPELARAEREAFGSRYRQHRSNLEVLGERRIQRELDLEIIDTRLDGLRRQVEISEQQRGIATELSNAQLFSRLDSLGISQSHEQLNLQIAELVLARPLAESALAEVAEQEEQERIRYQREATERLRDVEMELARQSELLARAESQEDRTAISSPIDGVVQNLQVNTIGGVVEPGQPIMQIVPVGETMVVEARLALRDIGHVRAGQPAVVRLSSYDYFRYGAIEGTISHVAADRNTTADGATYYLVRVDLGAQHLEPAPGETYPILAGMDAEVDVQIGTRSVIEYIFQPVLKLRQGAFSER